MLLIASLLILLGDLVFAYLAFRLLKIWRWLRWEIVACIVLVISEIVGVILAGAFAITAINFAPFLGLVVLFIHICGIALFGNQAMLAFKERDPSPAHRIYNASKRG